MICDYSDYNGSESVECWVEGVAWKLARERGESSLSKETLKNAWQAVQPILHSKLDAMQSAVDSTLLQGRRLRDYSQRCASCRDDPRSATRKSAGPRGCAASGAPAVPAGGAPLRLRLCADDDRKEVVQCAPTDTVQTLIDEYARRKGVDPARLRLLEDNIRLNTGMTIASCGLRHDQCLEVFTEIEGGGARPPPLPPFPPRPARVWRWHLTVTRPSHTQ